MPSSPIHKFPLSDDSANNSLECSSNITDNYEEKEAVHEMKKLGKCRFNPGHALLRKQVQRPIILHATKGFGRRRYTFSGHQDHKVINKKRRRFTSIALPTKFLLGGTRNDPLNLSSLQDEKINQQLNAFSPASSPMPVPDWRTQVQVVIPHNIYDPLNLNSGEDIEFNLLSSKPRKRRRHRKGKKDDENLDDQISPTEEVPPSNISNSCQAACISLDDSSGKEKIVAKSEHSDDLNKIVSPVVPQGSPIKTFKKSISRSISREAEERSVILKRPWKHCISKSRDRQNDTVKFRVNAEKFCYGNHAASIANWNFGDDFGTDPRLRYFDQDMFRDADVLDIGCNTGQIALHIAKHWHPRKVIGIDIDKKLINKAERTVRLYLSEQVAPENDFPDSMAVMYGPLSKLTVSKSKMEADFPNNISFFEANYVPASEDYLESQKPEFDTILCLRVTKWIHLNFGDEGLKMAFKRMFAQLRFGGRLILEYQPWFTYSSSKRITPSIYKTYQGLQIRPEVFCDYLLNQVGFTSCSLIGRAYNRTKAYRQDIFLLTKGYPSHADSSPLLNRSPTSYDYPMWYPNTEELADFTESSEEQDEEFSDFVEDTQ